MAFKNRVGRNSDGSLDEIILFDVEYVHLEQMDDSSWWIGIGRKDGTTDHINIFSRSGKAVVDATYEPDQ